MKWPAALCWIALFGALALAGACAGGEASPAGAEEARVIRVVDGDTIRVRLGGREETVRYIGIDTPETKRPDSPVECFGARASAENARLVSGRRVRLRFDAERRDRFGRLLAYVQRLPDGFDVNGHLVRQGFARTLRIAPNVARAPELARWQREARANGRGRWSYCAAR